MPQLLDDDIYDKEAEGEPTYGHPPDVNPNQYTPAGNRSDPRGDDGSAPNREELQNSETNPSYYNEGGDGGSSSNRGRGPRKTLANNDRGSSNLYNEGGDKPQGRLRQARASAQNTKGQIQDLKGRASKNKLLVGFGIGGSGAIALLIIALIIIAGAYKVVDFAEHVADYQFARTTRQMAEDATNITEEESAVASLPNNSEGNTLYNELDDEYTSAGSESSSLWSKFDQYRPGKVIANLDRDNILKFNTSQTRLGRTYISSVTVNGEDVPIRTLSIGNALKNKLIPGYEFGQDISVSKDFVPKLEAALPDDLGSVMRARVASQIRQELGVSLVAWQIGKYAGKTQSEADAQVEQDTYNVAKGSGSVTNSNVPDKVNSSAEAAEEAETAAVESPSKLAAIVKSGGQLPSDLINSVKNSFSTGLFSSIESFLSGIVSASNPIYKYAVPLCLIYDGSLSKSGSTIDSQNAEVERIALDVQTAAAQEKDGYNVNGEAVGAYDWKSGAIQQSNAERRASGLPVDTSSYPSTEASPTGEYSITDYGLGSTIGGILDSVAGPVCPVATNLLVGLGISAASLAAIFATSGAPAVSEGAVDASGQTLGSQLVNRVVATAGAGRDALNELFSFKTLANIGIIGAGTVAAKMLVMSQIGATHNSLATGVPYDNDSDSGLNIYAGQINQQQFYGAPMTDQDLGPDNTANQTQLGDQESQQSTFERYLAVDNPNSLVSRFAIDTSGFFSGSIFTSIAHLGASLLDPMHAFSSLFSSIFSRSAAAATPVTSANTYYGNVQFGYTQAEEDLLNSCPSNTHSPNLCSYQPLENQKILDESGNEDAIAAKYGVCFTDSVGTLLANGDIVRNSAGDVLADQGLCAPDNLSFDSTLDPNNPDNPGALANDPDSTSPNAHDMVFRWRVAMGYNNTLNDLTSDQTITASDNASASSSTTTASSSSGYASPFLKVSNLGTSRVDEGVDFTGSGPVTAIGDGTVVNTTNSGWPGGTFIVYKLTNGQAAGKYVYMAENCPTIQVHDGESITPSTVLCTMVDAYPHIETGWADGSELGNALAKSVYVELSSNKSYATAYGQNFRDLLTSLGVTVPSCYDFPGAKLSGTLPSGWPTWVSTPVTVSGSQGCG